MFKTIAVGTDGTETADKAVDVALDLAVRYQAKLLIFSVYTPVATRRWPASEPRRRARRSGRSTPPSAWTRRWPRR